MLDGAVPVRPPNTVQGQALIPHTLMQADYLAEQNEKLSSQLQQREQKVAELQKARHELFEKLMSTEVQRTKQEESRVHRELNQLQVAHG